MDAVTVRGKLPIVDGRRVWPFVKVGGSWSKAISYVRVANGRVMTHLSAGCTAGHVGVKWVAPRATIGGKTYPKFETPPATFSTRELPLNPTGFSQLTKQLSGDQPPHTSLSTNGRYLAVSRTCVLPNQTPMTKLNVVDMKTKRLDTIWQAIGYDLVLYSAISGDGRYVMYLAAKETTKSGRLKARWAVYDRTTKRSHLLRKSFQSLPLMSPDGKVIAYVQGAELYSYRWQQGATSVFQPPPRFTVVAPISITDDGNLLTLYMKSADTSWASYLYNAQTQALTLISEDNPYAKISGDGRFLVYNDSEYDRKGNLTNRIVFKEVTTGEMTYVGGQYLNNNMFSVSRNGRFVSYRGPFLDLRVADRVSRNVKRIATGLPFSAQLSISHDGSVITFESLRNLVKGDHNDAVDSFVYVQ